MPDKEVLNMGISTVILASKRETPWTHEEPQTNAKNVYVCYQLEAMGSAARVRNAVRLLVVDKMAG
jgi:hypothetical protein